ncbi:tRNA dimethylallyltransferase, mitochondrial [Oleoguttula sp. CCFEE 5521]
MLRWCRSVVGLGLMTRAPPKNPLIAIIGATGTGKSELAVALAQRYNGEVINGDAMQLYEGLSIITNKITVEERKGVPHHLLGCIGLNEPTWVVGTFVKKAIGVIEEIRSRGKLPILVGGTHYYTQSLLFKDALAITKDADTSTEAQDLVSDLVAKYPVLNESDERLMEELEKVDPVMARRWHPKDRRKIQRSLEIWLQTGRRASDLYAEQREAKNATTGVSSDSTPGLRYPSLVFWIHAETETLRERLDQRVDKMLLNGLLGEVEHLDNLLESNGSAETSMDETKGISVSIGFKEFRTYTAALREASYSEMELSRMREDAVERTKIATRQYAKRQVRWIQRKLISDLDDTDARESLYLLDGTDASSFNSSVVEQATQLTDDFLTATPMPAPSSLSDIAKDMLQFKQGSQFSTATQSWIRERCQLCDVTCVTEKSWAQHLRSRAHRRLESKQRILNTINTGREQEHG